MSSTEEFDIIIAGGGTSGCVVAGRLGDADPALSILVLEAGPPTRDDPIHVQPARYFHHYRPESRTVQLHVGRESAALGGRRPVVTAGQCVGGGSSVNFAVYSRAAASDYDAWRDEWENEGWGYADLLPLLKKCETYQIPGGGDTHGTSGPLKVSYGGYFFESAREFLDVAAQYDKTRGQTDDVNDMLNINAYGRWQKWIDADTGKRSDVPHHYIYNRSHPNLHIRTQVVVNRVIFEGHKAVGVEYQANPRLQTDADPTVRLARARKLVVLSAGTFGSPAILERSGIGAKNVLDNVGITQKVDLPGVGENYHDHQVIFPAYLASDDIETLDAIIRDDEKEIERWTPAWSNHGTGLLAQNGQDAGIKLRPNASELAAIGPAFAQRWADFFAPRPDTPVLWMGALAMSLGPHAPAPGRKHYTVGWYLMHPASTGRVHVASARDAAAPLDFHPGYLDRAEDLALHIWAYKRTRELARRMPSFRGELTGAHPHFSGSARAVGTEPCTVDAPDYTYDAGDEAALERYVRERVATTWHSLGTCAMKKREKGGVVDSRLNVYGVEGLKVADMSIAPSNVASNTYSTAVVIGEKAAVIIAEELGITLLPS